MLAVIGYPDNYTFPEIIPISEGGSLFSNTLSIKRHDVSELIRCNEEKEFIRTKMYMSPDMVNACFLPELNTINIPAGILNEPFYDRDASYATNLGAIGMIIAHEMGHSFDKEGAKYDENGNLEKAHDIGRFFAKALMDQNGFAYEKNRASDFEARNRSILFAFT